MLPTGISTTSLITATFSEPVQRSTVTGSTFLLKNSAGTSISGTVSLSADDKTATFDPAASLSVSTTYTATISPDSLHRVMDPSGNRMPTKTWSFTTGTSADITQPTVVSTNPASAATGISTTSLITATFSEPVQRSTVTGSTFLLKNSAGTSISGTVSLSADDKTATFDPATSLVCFYNLHSHNIARFPSQGDGPIR